MEVRDLREVGQITKALDSFGAAMLDAMLNALIEGKHGWDDPECEFWNGDFEAEILRRVQEKIQAGAKDNEVDIANYMMMLKYIRSRRSTRKEGE